MFDYILFEYSNYKTNHNGVHEQENLFLQKNCRYKFEKKIKTYAADTKSVVKAIFSQNVS